MSDDEDKHGPDDPLMAQLARIEEDVKSIRLDLDRQKRSNAAVRELVVRRETHTHKLIKTTSRWTLGGIAFLVIAAII